LYSRAFYIDNDKWLKSKLNKINFTSPFMVNTDAQYSRSQE